MTNICSEKWFSNQTRKNRKNLIKLAEIQKYRCCYCTKKIWISALGESGNKKDKATLEHIKCVSHGGKNTINNLLVACSDCNTKRGNNFSVYEYYDLINTNKYKNLVKENLKRKLNKRIERNNKALLSLAIFLLYAK